MTFNVRTAFAFCLATLLHVSCFEGTVGEGSDLGSDDSEGQVLDTGCELEKRQPTAPPMDFAPHYFTCSIVNDSDSQGDPEGHTADPAVLALLDNRIGCILVSVWKDTFADIDSIEHNKYGHTIKSGLMYHYINPADDEVTLVKKVDFPEAYDEMPDRFVDWGAQALLHTSFNKRYGVISAKLLPPDGELRYCDPPTELNRFMGSKDLSTGVWTPISIPLLPPQ